MNKYNKMKINEWINKGINLSSLNFLFWCTVKTCTVNYRIKWDQIYKIKEKA